MINFLETIKEYKIEAFLKTKINEKTSKLKSKDLLALCVDNYIPIGKIKTIEKVLNSAIAKKKNGFRRKNKK